ncbi:hypothetical protein WDW86_19950 [Bdellovibrionota bacterium FG-2]
MLNVFCFYLSILFVGKILGALLSLRGQSFSLGLPVLLLVGGFFFPDTATVLAVWLSAGLLGSFVIFKSGQYRFGLQDYLQSLRSHIPGFLYFIAYSALLIWQNPYLEIPSDPIGVHLFRIAEVLRPGVWSRGLLFSGVEGSTHLLGYVVDALAVQVSGLDRFDSALALGFAKAMMLSFVIYKTAYRILGRSSWAVLSLVLAQTVMGTARYSYFRYYTFAPSFFNMAMYIEILPLMAGLFQQRLVWRKFLLLAMVFVASFLTHKQEALFVGSAIALSLFWGCLPFAEPDYVRRNRKLLGLGLMGCLGILVAGIYTKKIVQSMPQTPEEYHIYRDFGFLKILRLNFHSSRLWATLNWSLIFCLGVIGLWGLVALLKNRKWDVLGPDLSLVGYLALISLWPLVAVFFPPVSTAYSFFFYDSVYYRLFYASPFFLVVPGILRDSFVGWGRKHRIVVVYSLLLILCGLLVFDKESRLPHLIAKVSEGGTPFAFRGEFQAIQKHAGRASKLVLSDAITEYSMPFFADSKTSKCKESRCWWPLWPIDFEREDQFLSALGQFSFVVFNGRQAFTQSDFAAHWPKDVRRVDRYYPKDFEKWVSVAEQRGWLRRFYEREALVVYEVVGHP